MDGKGGERGGKLDPLKTKQIHGSKPTKSQHTNKSQKILRLFLVGNFRIRTKNNKTRLETQRGGSEIMINMALIVGGRSNFKKIPTHTQDHGDA